MTAQGQRRDNHVPVERLSGRTPGHIHISNMIERLNREMRRRTHLVGAFPDGKSALMLISARIRYVIDNDWSTRRYLNMSRLGDTVQEEN